MARILDKLLPATSSRTIKLRLKYDWTKTEMDLVSEKCDLKKRKKLS